VSDGGTAEHGDWDFFISYTQADLQWAGWIAWTLEDAGYRVLIQAWDFVPGTNWVVKMADGMNRAARTIAVLSPAYLESVYAGAEWRAAWQADPDGRQRKLLVARVARCSTPAPLNQVVFFDLYDKTPKGAEGELLSAARLAISGERAKPTTAPPYPRAVPVKPAWPGKWRDLLMKAVVTMSMAMRSI